jgi:hypothetical protein
MNDGKKHIDPIPDEFASYEDAAEFWDSHDTMDYPDAFHSVDIETEFRGRYYEIELDEDVALLLLERARSLGVTSGRLASDLLRQQILPTAR